MHNNSIIEDTFAYLGVITEVQSVDALWQAHVEFMGQFGFDRIVYGFTRYMSETSLGDPLDWTVLAHGTDAYLQQMIAEGHLLNGPMIRWALENNGACSWSVLADSDALTAREQEVLAFNHAAGITAGYTISFRSLSSRSKGAIGLIGKPGLSQDDVDGIWAAHGAQIVVANNVMHLKLQSLPVSGQRQLTLRQKQVLQWVSDGKTTQDIADLIGVAPVTVEKHLRLAREALDVQTTAQAVLKAATYNQIFTSDGPDLR